MGMFDFLSSNPEEIQKRTAQAMANSGKPDMLDEMKKQEDLKTLPPQPLPGLGNTQGPSPASLDAPMQTQPAQPNMAPQGNWATKANPAQSQIQNNPYVAGITAAKQIAGALPQGGANMQMAGIDASAKATAQGYGEQADALAKQGSQMEESNARMQDIQKQKEAAQKEFDAKYDDALKDLKGTDIDSGRLWKNASTGSKILTGIGLALSAVGGPEAVARTNQIITQAIDRDIEDQKLAYGKKREGVQNMQTVYGRMLDRFGDKEKAELATRSFYLDLAKNKIDQIAAKTNNATAKGQAQIAKGQIQQQQDGIVSTLGMSLAQAQANKPMAYGQQIPDNYTPKNEDEQKRYIPGVGLATDAETKKGIVEDTNNFNRFNDSLSRLIDLRKKFGSETLPTQAKGEMEMLHGKLVLAMKDMAKLGVMSDTDFKLLNNIVANPTSYGPNVLSNLESLKNRSVGEFQKSLNTRLMNPVQSLPAKLQRGSF